MTLVGIHSACELVRLHTPFDAAVAALVDKLDITRDEAVTAMNAAHEHADWGIGHFARESVHA